ncbi:P-loop containing nucleoside triphosphate hydrolase protein [Pisolithus microcarpus]|nr:P-loop containing nucleoside triphosphate hydrolase protein [Pisolithus microcarpus]
MGNDHSHQSPPEWDSKEWAERELREAQERQKQAEEAARRAGEAAERATREAEEQRQKKRDAQLAAERAAQAAREVAELIRQQKEGTEKAEQRAREEAEARAREEAEARAREEAEVHAREDAEARAREDAEARAREAAEARSREEAEARAPREAAELARKVQAEREELERQLRRGIQPVVKPTLEEIRLAKAKVQYDDAMFHFAVAGIAGSGKSSLINALCGMNNSDPNAAPTGVNETTMEISRYVDTAHPERFAWYDVPGSGTLGTPDWQYFNSQGLYVFDCVLVLVNNRFTVTDQAILRNCHHFQIPTFIVRSKSDQHILNLMMDMGFDSDLEDTDSREQFFNIARERYISGTRQSVKDNLATANLPDQRVYIVSKKTLFSAAQNRQPMGLIDEVELLTDLYTDAARAEAEKAAKTAQEETKRAISAKEEIEKRWKEGIQPVVTPTLAELEAAKRRVQYKEGLFHFAVAGVAGSGKSSLINAFRGLRNREAGSAATGVTETTRVFDRYPDPNPQYPLVWYDIPGAGTLKIPDWQYFNAQGLYVFDCIIVLFDNRFTMTDVAILSNCARFNIPAFIVRSKADQHIRNVMKEMGYDSDDENADPESRDRLYQEARQHFIEGTRENIKSNLENANLPDRRVYIVSNDTLVSIVKGRAPRKAIDEIELLRDIVNQTLARRGRAGEESTSS